MQSAYAPSVVMLTMLNSFLVHQLFRITCLAPPCVFGLVTTIFTSTHSAIFNINGELVLTVLGPVDFDLVALRRPVRVSGKLIACEVVVPIGFELDREFAIF